MGTGCVCGEGVIHLSFFVYIFTKREKNTQKAKSGTLFNTL